MMADKSWKGLEREAAKLRGILMAEKSWKELGLEVEKMRGRMMAEKSWKELGMEVEKMRGRMTKQRLDDLSDVLLTDDERKRIANRALVLIVSGFLGLGLLSAGLRLCIWALRG